jgi:hypothetical protein
MIIDSPIISGSYAATGSLNQVGNVTITGSLTVTGPIIGALTGSVDSASFATTASYVSPNTQINTASFATTASYARTVDFNNTVVTSSYSLTASYVSPTTPIDTASFAITASYVSPNTQINTASFATTASYAVTASYADTSSYSVSSSYAVSSSYSVTASYADTASYSISSSLANTASYADSASIAISASNALTASFLKGQEIYVNDIYPTTGNSANRIFTENLNNGFGGIGDTVIYTSISDINLYPGAGTKAVKITGSLDVTNGITGSLFGTASNANLLDGLDSSVFTSTGSFNTFSSSILSYTSSTDIRLGSLETASGSAITRLGALEVASGSAISRLNAIELTTGSLNAASGSAITRLNSIENKTGSYATTGSNTFDGGAYFSSSFNPTGFTTTASLYTDGGLRVTKDAYISGTLYLNNVTVFGTQSVAYISSSQLNIGTNIITVNTDTPSVRFGGLAVYDSGSTGLTGSMLWDSQANHWVYSNPSGSNYSGGMFISGPRTAALGSEQGTTSCMLLAGQGGDHLTSSMIYHSSTVTCIPNTLIGSTICTTMTNASCIGIGTTTPTDQLSINNGTSNSYATLRLAGSNRGGQINFYNQSCPTAQINVDQSGNVDILTGIFNGSSISSKFSITNTGQACFACSIQAGANFISNITTDTASVGTSAANNATYNYTGYSGYWGIRTTTTGNNFALDTYNGGTPKNVLTITQAGVATFLSNVCVCGDLSIVSAGSTTALFDGTNPTLTLRRNNNGNASAAINFKGSSAVKWQMGTNQAVGLGFEINEGDATANKFYIAPGGAATFSSTITGTTIYGSTAICSPVGLFSGCVGIGTSSPISVLDVQVGPSTRRFLVNYDDSLITVKGASSNGAPEALRLIGDGIRFNTGTTGSGTEAMRITSCGNVGIGTTSPAYKFVVSNSGAAGLEVDPVSPTIAGGVDLLFYNRSTSAYKGASFLACQFYFGGGNVGIGVTNPNIYGNNFTKQVTISNTDSSQYANISMAGGSGASGGIDFGNQTVRHAGVYGLNGSDLGFYTNGSNSGNGLSERMRITSTGSTVFQCSVCLATGTVYLPGAIGGRTAQIEFGNSGTIDILGMPNQSSSFYLKYGCNSILFTNDSGGEILRMCCNRTIAVNGPIVPTANGTIDLGTSSLRWCTVYTSDLSLSNGIGDYTMVEGENDLFLYNNKQCKVYKFLLQEVCPEIAPAKRST